MGFGAGVELGLGTTVPGGTWVWPTGGDTVETGTGTGVTGLVQTGFSQHVSLGSVTMVQ